MDSGATEHEILEKKLEEKLQDPAAKPMSLPLEFLKVITCNFSTERELGRGAYGVVYKGVLQSRKVIAVKKIFDNHLLDLDNNSNNKQFENEITCLMGVWHQNVIQLVGYCVQTRSEVMMLPSGEHVMVQTPACLLCFEFQCKGSLDKHISDDFSVLDWDTRYEIIRGVCRGLHYLHHECHIVHLDLKPQNILMDATMMPKITDFGLSRLLGEQKSKTVTKKLAGTLGYMAKEYIDRGIISYKADIFSLGVIIIELMTGRRDYPDISERTETSLKHFTEDVVGCWRKGLDMSPEKNIQQVEQCISIALRCLEPDLNKRPTSLDIVQNLNAEEPKCSSLGYTTIAEKIVHQWPGFPEGVKFDPSEQELICHLLGKHGKFGIKPHPFIDEFIPTVEEDIFCTHPQKLPGVKQNGRVSHFFHRTFQASNTGTTRRKINTDDAYVSWHKMGKTKPVFVDGKHRGSKKIMVLYMRLGKGGKAEKTNWVLHQYHLGTGEDEKDGEYVVSKLFFQQQFKPGELWSTSDDL